MAGNDHRGQGAGVTLIVYTSRIGAYLGPDVLDITRSTAHNVGEVMKRDVPGAIFAPSWNILNRFDRAREAADREHAYGRLQRWDHMHQAAWEQYCKDYTAEMRNSYRVNRAGWDALLKREIVTLVCFCVNHERCHRTLLAGMLEKLGANFCGERVSLQRKLPGLEG
jgi:hypothetical protein